MSISPNSPVNVPTNVVFRYACLRRTSGVSASLNIKAMTLEAVMSDMSSQTGRNARLLSCVGVAFALLLPLGTQAAERSTSESVGHAVGSTLRDIGTGAGEVGREIGQEAAEFGRTVGGVAKGAYHAVGDGARAVGHAARDGSRGLVRGIRGEPPADAEAGAR